MTDPYDFNAFLFLGARRPEGVEDAPVSTTHIKSTRPHKRQVIHRPEFTATADLDGKTVLGARYLCGHGCAEVVPVEGDVTDLNLCSRCERLFSHDSRWAVYCYRDEEGAPLYIGQTFWITERDRQHATSKKSAAWYSQQLTLEVLSRHRTQEEAVEAERQAIHDLRPRFNVQHNRGRRVAA
ncbi:hypothetical protein NOK12_17020 [Nocardioides sp. OK12]|uniref:GIY-YIG nuclease family protein n=1 Tax=Nocardioides sp. OK12 TaxID=2758661 RepID=UPI0021C29B57|nr:GIY-YIG nuclease family protein [Nocardioides sp. OK12]GHJ59184.1 hypothetical protein NOK12_17020 [Nocardioides sp. OK12]